jgi:hypothetical protein
MREKGFIQARNSRWKLNPKSYIKKKKKKAFLYQADGWIVLYLKKKNLL